MDMEFLRRKTVKNIDVNDNSNKRLQIAIFSPHADDMELGCGATLARLIDNNEVDIYYYVFITRKRTLSGETIPDNNKRLSDCKRSFKFLITGNDNLSENEMSNDIFTLSAGTTSAKFEFIRECSNQELYLYKNIIFQKLRKYQSTELKSVDIVMLPSPNDFHHDHKTLEEIGRQIFRKGENVLTYFSLEKSSYLNVQCNPNLYVDISQPIKKDGIYSSLLNSSEDLKTYMDVKFKLLSYYETEKNATWFNYDYFKAVLQKNAYDAYITTTNMENKYAEAFECVLKI